ncbi:MAG: TIM barrel protein [Chloroflexi bacterium]|nr:TIM barrel protein [Chloroflexota bacterium]
MEPLSLSTMYSAQQFPDIGAFADLAARFGFRRLELNYHLTPDRLRALRRAWRYDIPSVHWPCPAGLTPEGQREQQLLLSHTDGYEREQAVRSALRSIDLASEVGARWVVLHLGAVEEKLALPRERELRRLYSEGGAESKDFQEARAELVRLRAKDAQRPFAAAMKSLDRLCTYVQRQGYDIRFGLETRNQYVEIPIPDEMAVLLREFAQAVGYWHDVGHAEYLSRLSLIPHGAWFERFEQRLAGCHLHDIQGLVDHRPPGLGDMPWEAIAPHIPASALRVLEINEGMEQELVRLAPLVLAEAGIGPPVAAPA